MERALVIYESMFGNTRTIAQAVAEGLSSRFVTDLTEVSLAPTRIAEDVSLVVVGGPTHAFGLTRPRTREDAANQADGSSSLLLPVSGSGWRLSRHLRPDSGQLRSTRASTSRGSRVPPPGAPRSVFAVSGSDSSPRRRAFS